MATDEKYGVPDEEMPELTEADAKRARRWRPGDPVATDEVARLRYALERISSAAANDDVEACLRLARRALG